MPHFSLYISKLLYTVSNVSNGIVLAVYDSGVFSEVIAIKYENDSGKIMKSHDRGQVHK